MTTLTKGDLVTEVAKKSGLTVADAQRALNAVESVLISSLKGGDEVNWTGYLKAYVANRAARNGRNPATGAAIKIPAGKVAKIKVGAKLKAAVK
ncbi:MAG: HU family DNA-binding protein [Bifidobacteriaceae bacterium]|jgi:DNA-binding protein HU-beta|nr:HU family DNA-binding protein [Bifidobacteriaceae bacterium]